MNKTLTRVSLLLFVFSVAGFIGLNNSANPSRIRSAHAANVEILLQSIGLDELDFGVGSPSCPDTLVEGASCTVIVQVINLSDLPMVLAAPVISDSGPLDTCTGDDATAPLGGGNNLTTTLQNLSYTPNVTELNPGEDATFEIFLQVAVLLGNACQDKKGTVLVSLSAGGDEPVVPTATPTQILIGETPTNGSIPTPIRGSGTSGSSSNVAGARSTDPTAEVLPARFPSTGGGPLGTSAGMRGYAELLFLATAMIAVGIFLVAMSARSKREEQS